MSPEEAKLRLQVIGMFVAGWITASILLIGLLWAFHVYPFDRPGIPIPTPAVTPAGPAAFNGGTIAIGGYREGKTPAVYRSDPPSKRAVYWWGSCRLNRCAIVIS